VSKDTYEYIGLPIYLAWGTHHLQRRQQPKCDVFLSLMWTCASLRVQYQDSTNNSEDQQRQNELQDKCEGHLKSKVKCFAFRMCICKGLSTNIVKYFKLRHLLSRIHEEVKTRRVSGNAHSIRVSIRCTPYKKTCLIWVWKLVSYTGRIVCKENKFRNKKTASNN
jgi:hypothetical protein